MAALGLGLAVFIVLGLAGVVGSQAGETILVFVQYLNLFVAGYLAARFSRENEALNGGMAGLAVYGLTAIVSLIGGASLGPTLIVVLAVVAAVIGTAGGVLAAGGHRRMTGA